MHLTTQPPTPETALPNRESGTRLLEGWTALWSGDLALAEQIIDPKFRLCFANIVEGTGTDSTLERSTLLTFITAHRQALPELTYDLDGPPVIDGAHGRLASRWTATYVDGSGTPVTKSGIDMFSITDGRISGVWSLTGRRRFAV
ncbi:hypothetical protein [Streptomyces sp. NPDC001903]|uniref:hypothetical protein n=1 Tax=Streptomyces sp. NPDC001903 TaxID=3364622 RepID=UPI003683C1F7